MNKSKLMERFRGCYPVLQRCGITVEKIAAVEGAISKLDGPALSKKHKWLHRVEVACKHEAEHWADLTPKAWGNLALLSPGSEDIRKLKSYRKAVKVAFKS
jgi:hypothetical protein